MLAADMLAIGDFLSNIIFTSFIAKIATQRQ